MIFSHIFYEKNTFKRIIMFHVFSMMFHAFLLDCSIYFLVCGVLCQPVEWEIYKFTRSGFVRDILYEKEGSVGTKKRHEYIYILYIYTYTHYTRTCTQPTTLGTMNKHERHCGLCRNHESTDDLACLELDQICGVWRNKSPWPQLAMVG